MVRINFPATVSHRVCCIFVETHDVCLLGDVDAEKESGSNTQSGRGDCCRRQQGQPLPGQVAAGGDVTRCRSGQAEPAVDGTCVRKGVTGGARAPRALSLWNALVSRPRGTKACLEGHSVTLARREARAPIRKSANGVWSALLGSNIRGALGTRGGSDRASRFVVGCSAPRLIVGCRRRVGNFRCLGKQPRVGLAGRISFCTSRLKKSIPAESCQRPPRTFRTLFQIYQPTTSEKNALSGGADAAGTSWSSFSSSEAASSGGRTPDQLSGFSEESLVEILETPSSRGREVSVQHAASQARVAAEEVATGGEAIERTASQTSPSDSEGSESSGSSAPRGEPIEARQRPSGRPMRINDQRVYRRGNWEMVELADGRPVYSVDYFTSSITPRYLAALREEFDVPPGVELLAPGADDLPSRPPPGYITLSAEYFRAGLRLPFHPFLRRALTRLNVALAQLNANAYRILVGCYILWMRNFAAEIPFKAFQNLYRMKSAPSSTGFYYFQGFKGTFITSCPDSDKQFKHLWFYAGGRWLHGELPYNEVPRSERVPVTFRNGYTWARAPHIPELTSAMIDALREQSDQVKSQHRLLSLKSLKDNHWLGSSSSSALADNQPSAPGAGVTIARMPEPTVHYQSRTGGLSAAQQTCRLAPTLSEPSSGNESMPGGSFSSWVADEDLDRVIQEFYPARGLRIEEPMADRQQGRKRPSDEERRAKLMKMVRTGCHGKVKTILPSSQPAVQPTAPTSRSATPQASGVAQKPQAARPTDRHEHRSSRSKDDRPTSRSEVRSSRPREDPRSREIAPSSRPETSSRDSPAHRVLVNKISDKLSVQVAESCRRPDAVTALEDNTEKLIEAIAREATNRAADDLKAAESAARDTRSAEKAAKEARNLARDAEKNAIEEAKAADARAKAVEERAQRAEERVRAAKEWAQATEKDASDARQQLEEAGQKAEADLASARAQAVDEYLQSDEFQARLVTAYKDGMRDMKLGFTDANPTLVGVNWSFLPEESGETMVEDASEEGEVSGAVRAPEEVVVLDGDEQPAAAEQPVAPDQQATRTLDITIGDLSPDQLD
uniref:Uncharacterized protein n=1 Tax=Ficus carica TaxID=3494 RepID=A0AA88E3M3_FICCA|nr:hypothetical protein TIFTF001_036115 [Ficus carica]